MNQQTISNEAHKHTIRISGQESLHLEQPGVYTVILDQPGAEVSIHGVFSLRGQEKALVSIEVHHQAPHTRAQTILKGVAADQSHLTFIGRIIIDPDCGDTNSFLTERILLTSDQAHADAIPDLEILTDDVKCSHAVSISRIPEIQLFYLMSRGISRSDAEELIVQGFLEIKE